MSPSGLLQPVRGSGEVWREQLGGPQAAVGWALEPERGYDMFAQSFANGLAFTGPDGPAYVLYADGTWVK